MIIKSQVSLCFIHFTRLVPVIERDEVAVLSLAIDIMNEFLSQKVANPVLIYYF